MTLDDVQVGLLVVMALLAGFLHGAHWCDRQWVRFIRAATMPLDERFFKRTKRDGGQA